jgi:hypothetical protein
MTLVEIINEIKKLNTAYVYRLKELIFLALTILFFHLCFVHILQKCKKRTNIRGGI